MDESKCPKCSLQYDKNRRKFTEECGHSMCLFCVVESAESGTDKCIFCVDELDGNRKMPVIAIVPEPKIIKKETTTTVTSGDSQGSKKDGESAPTKTTKEKRNTQRGFAIVSAHKDFSSVFNLSKRSSAIDDTIMMDKVLKKYGCKVLLKEDAKTDYYEKYICEEIEENMDGKDYFIFALSTHGEEKEEVQSENNNKEKEDKFSKTNGKKSEKEKVPSTSGEEKEKNKSSQRSLFHYFYTKDGQCQTQRLISKISEVKSIENKLKIFIIQACSSRVVTDRTSFEHLDPGVPVFDSEFQDLSQRINVPDSRPSYEEYDPPPPIDEGKKGRSCTSPSDGSKERPCTPPYDGNKGRPVTPPSDRNDERPCTTPSDEKEERLPSEEKEEQPPTSPEQISRHDTSSGKAEFTKKDSQKRREERVFTPVKTVIPHLADSVIVFASMSGKTAYSRVNDSDAGGWLIKAFSDILDKKSSQDKVHIFDVLNDVNRMVSQRECEVELQKGNPEQNIMYLRILAENAKNSNTEPEIQEMIDLVLKAETKDESLYKKVKELAMNVEKSIGPIRVKAQSCYIHNLSFEDDKHFHLKYSE